MPRFAFKCKGCGKFEVVERPSVNWTSILSFYPMGPDPPTWAERSYWEGGPVSWRYIHWVYEQDIHRGFDFGDEKLCGSVEAAHAVVRRVG